jgi:ppGpp synthetase/RelA/SpoT-type nucleotidyltranferase
VSINELKKRLKQADKNFKKTKTLSKYDVQALSEWRTMFSPIVNALSNTLSKIAIDKKNTIHPVVISTRLKRTPSIISKLQRFPDMVLTRMQDIGGVRVVYQTIEQVRMTDKRFEGIYGKKTDNSFRLIRVSNYIEHPKDDGYRSIHHIYKYQGKFKEAHGLVIELQIRTAIQHMWATAVETFDLKQKSSLKIGGGEQLHRRFFYLASSLFSKFEGKHKKLPKEQDEMAFFETKEMLEINHKCHILPILKSIAEISKEMENKDIYGFILELNIKESLLTIHPFSEEEDILFNKKYLEIEQNNKDLYKEVVLVYAKDIRTLKDAFPNYYMDSRTFIDFFERVGKAFEKTQTHPTLTK